MQWFVMRDLKRANAKTPAYKQLGEGGFDVFTPMKWVVGEAHGRRQRLYVPYVQDLLFVRAAREDLDPIVSATATLQYRYVRGAAYCTPMTVRDTDMERFIKAVRTDDNTTYYSPDELTPSMYGRSIRIVGGPLDGYEGRLLSVRGMRKKRLLVEVPGLLTAAVEVNPEFITFL